MVVNRPRESWEQLASDRGADTRVGKKGLGWICKAPAI